MGHVVGSVQERNADGSACGKGSRVRVGQADRLTTRTRPFSQEEEEASELVSWDSISIRPLFYEEREVRPGGGICRLGGA